MIDGREEQAMAAVLARWGDAANDAGYSDALQLPFVVLAALVLEIRPRVGRTLLAIWHPRRRGHAVASYAAGYLPPAPPGLLSALLATVPLLPVRGQPSTSALLAMAEEAGLDVLLTQDIRRAWDTTFGGSLHGTVTPITVRDALDGPAATYASALIVTEWQITTTLARPNVWPILVDAEAPSVSERRALLEQLGSLRGGREVVLRGAEASLDDDGVTIDSFAEMRHRVRLTRANGFLPTASSAVASSAALMFDILNEPTPSELPFISRWFRPQHLQLLDALRGLAQRSVEAEVERERLAWQLTFGHDGVVWATPRRQRAKKNGRGWLKGKEMGLVDVVADEGSLVTDQDRQVAAQLTKFRPNLHAATRLLCGHPALLDAAGEPITLKEAPISLVINDLDGGDVGIGFVADGLPLTSEQVSGEMVVRAIVDKSTGTTDVTVSIPTTALWEVALAARRAGNIVPAIARAELERVVDEIIGGGGENRVPVQLSSSLQGELQASSPTLVVRLGVTGPCALSVRCGVVAGRGAAFVAPGDGAAVVAGNIDGVRVRFERDLDNERDLASRLREGLADGLIVDDTIDPWEIAAAGDAALTLLQRTVDAGAVGDVEVVWRDQRRLQLVGTVKATSLKMRVRSVHQWLGLSGEATIDDEHLSLATLLAAAREQRRYVQLGEDRYALLSDELREGLRGVAALTTDDSTTADGVEVSFAAAHALDALHDRGAEFEEGAVWTQLQQRLDNARAVDDVQPAGLLADLRPYQREGLLFLRRLAAFGTGGVLADDMGLGKTVQAIGLLLDRADHGAAVVVAPTSLGFNWSRELQRFAPSLNAHFYADASDRAALLARVGPRDVVIASYGLVDADLIAARFHTAIFDEAQALKNADTQRARAARDLDAPLKIALSGTPLENHLGELWSLFRIVAPGLLGSQEQFRKRFLVPIEKDRSLQHRRQLGQTIRPFLLRRTKAEVLQDLPPLTEQRLDVVAAKDERAIYDALRAEVLSDLDDGSDAGDRRFKILAGLTRLRLCCCHPVLVDPAYRGSSAKLSAAVETLERVRDAGHKALVFSQFVKCLNLVEPMLVAAGLRVLRLDGSTPEAQRRVLVDQFQRGEADIFLLSLKAGGAGLNLTAADVVVHLDPWWNPAVEAQAIARAHRMGRTAPVTAIRIVVTDTIEEAILKLHDEKRELVDAVLAGAGGGGALSFDDIAALLNAPQELTPVITTR